MTIFNPPYSTIAITLTALLTLIGCEDLTAPEPNSYEEVTFTFEQDRPDRASPAPQAKRADPHATGRFTAKGAFIDAGTYTETRIESPGGEAWRTLYGWRKLAGNRGTVVLDCRGCRIRYGVLTEGTLRIADATGPYAGFLGSQIIFDVTTRTDTMETNPQTMQELRFNRVR